MNLIDACHEIVSDHDLHGKYPNGINASEVLSEIRVRRPLSFPNTTVKEVSDLLRQHYAA